MSYLHWLLGISAVFVLLERLFPWRNEQSVLRPGWLRDVGFVALNGHVFSLWTAGLTGAAALAATPLLPEFLDAMMPFLRDHFGNPSRSPSARGSRSLLAERRV